MKFLWKLRPQYVSACALRVYVCVCVYVALSFMSGPGGLIKSGSLIFDAAI